MTRLSLILLLWLLPVCEAAADAVVASHTIRSRTILGPDDVHLVAEDLPGAVPDLAAAIGMEARVVLYAGRPIRPENLVPPAVVERNQIVTLVFHHAGLAISTEGRSLARAALGEPVRVMNLQSRTTVTGIADLHGRIIVAPASMNFGKSETQR